MPDLVISALGVTSAIGRGKDPFSQALLSGQSNFGVMSREGRQHAKSQFIGAEIPDFAHAASLNERLLRTVGFSTQMALNTLAELFEEAKLQDRDPERIGLIVGGSNFNQRELSLQHDKYRDRVRFLRPFYGLSFLDSDLVGACTQTFDIRGLAHTIGSASASGLTAIIEAAEAVCSGRLDRCIALGALMDLSYWECAGFRAMGAMGSDRFADQPHLASRPCDRDRDGFIFGEACAAVLIESSEAAKARACTPYAHLLGWATHLDANREPNPSFAGECRVIQDTLKAADLDASDIDYINPHLSGSIIGDQTELEALTHCGLQHAHINTTKSITGHALSAAGTLEVVATCLQLRQQQLHPCLNLENPIATDFNWVPANAPKAKINTALKLSMGFGGINSALCMRKYA